MAPQATIQLKDGELLLLCPQANLRETRPFAQADQDKLSLQTARHRKAARQHSNEKDLLHIGRELHTFLNGADKFLDRAKDTITPPFLVEFQVTRENTDAERTLLDAP